MARAHGIDLIVAVGGGSSMDCAKGINFLLTNGGRMADYKGFGKATRPMLPSIGVPTTAGTGSEAQSFALIADDKTHMKMACGDRKAAFRVAILDPEVTVSQPAKVTRRHRHRRPVARPGVVRLHARATRCRRRSRAKPGGCWSRTWRSCCADPSDLEARGAMQLGRHFAGTGHRELDARRCHACANPLTAHYGITHGIAIGIMLPHVIRFNAPAVGSLYADLAHEAGLINGDPAAAAEALARRIDRR